MTIDFGFPVLFQVFVLLCGSFGGVLSVGSNRKMQREFGSRSEKKCPECEQAHMRRSKAEGKAVALA